MITVDQYQYIRMAHKNYGKGVREIARDTGHARQTIRKALRGEEPKYRMRQKRPSPVMDEFKEIVEGWLDGDEDAPRKQRHTAKRIYDRLVDEHGFRGHESTVRRYVRRRKIEKGLNHLEAMVPLDPELAVSVAEVDWGESQVDLGGQRRKVKIFHMRSIRSGKTFMRAYPSEAQEMFFDAHNHAFAYFGGCFREIVYDNLKAAVARVYRGKSAEEQTRFQMFRAHYGFEATFCTPGKGNEKGGVESGVGYGRRNFLVPIPSLETMADLNAHLLEACQSEAGRVIAGRDDQRSIAQRAAEEREQLIELEEPYPAWRVLKGRADKYATVRVSGTRYSVPSRYAGCAIDVECDASEVRLYAMGKRIAVHQRAYGGQKWCLDPDHYLELIRCKVRAFRRARPLAAWRSRWPASYDGMLRQLRERQGERQGTRVFLDILMLHRDHDDGLVERAVELALAHATYHLAAIKDLIRQLGTVSKMPRDLDPGMLPRPCLRHTSGARPDLEKYDRMIKEGR